MVTLPEPIATYYAAEKTGDFATLARCFAPDAVVFDEGRTRTGHVEIESWMRDAKARYQHRTEVLGISQVDGAHAVRVRVAGQFPNSPVTIQQIFDVQDGAIRSLRIG